jgi:uncharacterized protein YdhG (YjbR/CyaY superfamily)
MFAYSSQLIMPPSSSSKQDAAKAKSQVRAYVAKLPPKSRTRLKKLRDTIKSSLPKAIDGFSYGIPSFKLDGKTVVWYAAFKEHVSMFPLSAADRRAADRAGYETSKGGVRFPMTGPLPVSLVKRVVKSRLAVVKKQAKA